MVHTLNLELDSTIKERKGFNYVPNQINSTNTVKPVLCGHSKIDKTKVFKKHGSLISSKVLQNALLDHSAILLTCIKR